MSNKFYKIPHNFHLQNIYLCVYGMHIYVCVYIIYMLYIYTIRYNVNENPSDNTILQMKIVL